MALLRATLAALAAWTMSAAGCSLALDPNDLSAERVDVEGDTFDHDGADAEPGPNVVIRHSGAAGCELLYQSSLDTGCAETCPNEGGWTLVFDATGSAGVTSYDWRFSATESFEVKPKKATGGRVELLLDVPNCGDRDGATIGSATVNATLVVDGDEATPFEDQLDFSVRQVSSCGST